jgi:K+-sensing histidine kinase KdpD
VIYGDIQNRLAFTFFVPAALVAAWYGGVGPGLLATGLGLVLGSYFFLLPRIGMWPPGPRELMAIGVYTLTTMLCVFLCENLHRCIRHLEQALDSERHRHGHTTQPGLYSQPPDAAPSR